MLGVVLMTMLSAMPMKARPWTATPPKAAHPAPWAGEEMPLPLSVKTPEDLQFKALAERQYLIFNLLAGGKAAWDAEDWGLAASRWESLLRLPELPAELGAPVKVFAEEARKRSGGASPQAPAVALAEPAAEPEPEPPAPKKPKLATVTGTVSGGAAGPGGTVVVLRRASGATPRPKPGKGKVVLQKGKAFVPRVLAVPVGTAVDFRNEDPISHDVFSLSKPNDFDLGLYKAGLTRSQVFDTPGAVQLLCNIHSSMIEWIYVVDSPWFAQADASGAFRIRVPPGEYTVEAWNETAAEPTRQALKVEGDSSISLTVGGDRRAPAFVPDKYGKPRQVQLGY